ncbi:putative involucrin repeat protein [Phaeoacremonium minimum UCRPA7]|uniref:Putative involucrin repeat protein n=1 Tax=Phaeoacremonium minimum (strain UCR-PA7) TaxID=1286976 RepID=R8BMI5_PHAM7|nr:putative involucrin repeat protein [Phaeoacremonium minimum UCRPA7]EOO00542.1 putative involucrin repeat protein [Phaeoacremonium minimum UCRPA7]
MRHDPSIAARSRKYSSSDLSSSSSSYLDISRRYPKNKRYGGILKSFFSTPSEHKHHYRRKKKRRIFGFGNSSSSSVNSDLAYGTGFIKKSKSRGALSPQETIHGPAYTDGRRAQPKREKTDEEIMEIGRKLAQIARDQNAQDLAAMGRRKPTSFEATVTGFDKFRRQNTGDSVSRGIGPSRPHGESSPDDSEWESASEDEYSDDVDSGLAYGASASALSLIANKPSKTSKPSQVPFQKPPEEIRPPDRKSSVVDPKMFGPVNSLRGYVQTPCGFDKNQPQPPMPNKRYSAPVGPITPIDSASIEARPMQTVYAVPTSDPRIMGVTHGSVASSRPDPVPIQAPKPIAPVPQRLYQEDRIKDLDRRESKSSRRQSDGKSLAETAAVGAAGVAAGMAIMSDRKDKRDDRSDRDPERRDREREKEKRRQRELELEREIARREAELREREERYAREKEHRRSKRDSNVKIIDERDQKRSSRDDRRDDRSDKRSETDKRSDKRDADVEVEYEREKRRQREREREKKRDEPTNGHDRDKRRIKDDRKDDHRESRKEERQDARRVSQPSEPPALDYRRVEDPNLPASKAPIDPFQFQVDDDAFQTPLYSSTPMRPLTPAIVTVEREPDFSKFDDRSIDGGRMSRRDSFEEEMRDAKHIYDETSHSTAPIDPAAMAAAVAVVEREQREHKRGRDPEPRSPKDPSQREDAQAEADRYYAELRTARRLAEEKIRSRSNSPDVTDKYNKDEPEEPIIRIVTPPEMDHKEKKTSKYDGPNADVRIDNIIVPKELSKFKAPITSPDDTHLPVVVFKSRDPSAERERPLLNLVLPTPVPTPTPEKQRKAHIVVSPEPEKESVSKEPEPERKRARDISIGPRGEIIENDSPSTPKSVSWGKNETKRYYPESPEHSRERSADEQEPKVVEVAKSPRPAKKSSGWGIITAAIVGVGGAAAAASDDEPKKEASDLEKEKPKPVDPEQQGSPKQRTVLPKGTTPRNLDEEERDIPPAPGPKPASPRSSQMPGAFADDLDFAARLAGGLQQSGFDPNIVIDDATYRRRDSPPGSNDDYPLYKQPFAETVTDLGVHGADGSMVSKSASEPGFIPREAADSPTRDKDMSVDDIDIPSKSSKKERRKQEKASRRRSGDDYKDIEVIEEPEEEPKAIPESEPVFEPVKLSKKEQRKKDKAAKAAQWADEEEPALTQEPEPIEPSNVAEDEWAETPSKKSKKSKKSKRSSSNWEDEEATPTDDRRISVPVDAFKDLQDDKTANADEEWDTPKKSKKKSKRDSAAYDSPSRSESIAPSEASTGSSRDKSKKSSRRKSGQDYESSSKGYDIPEDEPPDRRDRKRDSYKPIDRDVSSVVSDPAARYDRFDSRSVASRDDDELGSVVSAPTGSEPRRKSSKSEKRSSKEEKRSSGSFFGLFGKSNGTEEKEKEISKSSKDGKKEQSFLDNAGTLGAGAGLAGAVAAYLSRSNATDAPSEKETSDIDLEPAQKQTSSREVEILDPEIVHRVIKPAIDPQYGDLLPLPPSEPGSPHWESEDLPALPDSRPNTPPEQERALLRDKLHTHVRRRSAYETPIKSPSHTAIPIQFRIGQRSVPSSPGIIRSSPIPSMPSPSTPTIELGSAPPKRLSRPTSWDSSREIKPLYLLEQAGRSSSHVTDDDFDSTDLPPLPPSRESPGPEYEVKQEDVEYFRLNPSERDVPPLHVDTSVRDATHPDDQLGSQDSTPKAEQAPPFEQPLEQHNLGSESEDAFEDAEEHIQRSISPSPTPHEPITDDLPTLPRMHDEIERPWDDITEGHHTPAPVDPVSKDRSSYLLRSTPRSAEGDIIERSSPPSPSPKAVVEPKFNHDDLALGTALGVAAGGLVTAAMLHSDDATSQGTSTPVQASRDTEISKDLSSTPGDHPPAQIDSRAGKDLDLPSENLASAETSDYVGGAESEAQEFSFVPSKKGKKGKKGRRNLIEEDGPLALAKSEVLSEPFTANIKETPPSEATMDEWAFPTTSKKGKKKKKSQFESWEPEFDGPQIQDAPQAIDDLPAAESLPSDVQESTQEQNLRETPLLERSSSASKKGKKKGKRFSAWELEEPSQHEPLSQPNIEDVPLVTTEVGQPSTKDNIDLSATIREASPITEDFSLSLSKKDKKKKKGKKAQAWEPEDDGFQAPARGISSEPSRDIVDVPLSTSGTGEASRDIDLGPDQLSRSHEAVKSGESEIENLPTSTKATPAGGPGAWVPTPATAGSQPGETGYFPSAPTVHRPSVSEGSQVDEKKGYFPSALSMLPITAPLAAVGSLFSRGKRDKKDSESGDIDSEDVTEQPGVPNTLDESQRAPVQTIHSSDQLSSSPTANVLVEPSGASADMALRDGLSEDKSLGDTPSSAVDTTDLLPDALPTAPEATELSVAEHQPPQPISSESAVYEQRTASPTPRDIQFDDILPIPSGEDESSMEPIIEEPSNVADDKPISTVDWEQETGSRKKGKKGKKKRQSLQDVSQSPTIQEAGLPATDPDLARDEPSSIVTDDLRSLPIADPAVDIWPSDQAETDTFTPSKASKKSLKKSKKRMDSVQLVPWEDDVPQNVEDESKGEDIAPETLESLDSEVTRATAEGSSQELPGTSPSSKKSKKEKKRLRASRTLSWSDDMVTDSADDPSTRAASVDTENLNWDDLKPSRLTVFSDVGVNDEEQSEADWDTPRKGKKGKQKQETSQQAADDSAALSESVQSEQISKESAGDSAAQDTESQGLDDFQFTSKKGKSSKKKKRQSVTWADSREESPLGTSRLATQDLPAQEVRELSPISPVRKDVLFPEVESNQTATQAVAKDTLEHELSSTLPPVVSVTESVPAMPEISTELSQQEPLQVSEPIEAPIESREIPALHDVQEPIALPATPETDTKTALTISDPEHELKNVPIEEELQQEPAKSAAETSNVLETPPTVEAVAAENIQSSSKEIPRDPEASTAIAEDEFPMTTKKSKKDKKKRKSKTQDELEETSQDTGKDQMGESTAGENIAKELVAAPVLEEVSYATRPADLEPESLPKELEEEPAETFVLKKSKKEKKKRKSKVQDDFDSLSGATTPVTQPVLGDDAPVASPDVPLEPQEENIASNLTPELDLGSQQEAPVDDDFSWASTTKKSKKDKKKGKGKSWDEFEPPTETALPTEDTSTQLEPSQALAESKELDTASQEAASQTKDISEPTQDENAPTILASQSDQPTEQDPVVDDEFSWAPTMKTSKKDKKKRKSKIQDDFESVSGTVTPLPEESRTLDVPFDNSSPQQPSLEQISLGSDILTEEPQQLSTEPDTIVEDEPSDFFVTKKSKKDKKKKSLSLDVGASEDSPAETSKADESVASLTQSREEPSTTIAEQAKDDDWASFSTLKKSKKDKKKKRASVSWAEPETESGSQTPAVDELPEASRAIEDITIPAELVEDKTIQLDDLKPEDIEPPSTSTDSLSKSELESKVDDGDDTLIVAGGTIPERPIPLPELEAKVDDLADTTIVAGGSLPEQHELRPSTVEHLQHEQSDFPPVTEDLTLKTAVPVPASVISDEPKPSNEAKEPSEPQTAHDDDLSKDLASPSNIEEPFVTPSEFVPVMTEESESTDVTPLKAEGQEPEGVSEFFTTKKSKRDKKKKRASQVQDFESQPSSLPETPFETPFEDSRQLSLGQEEPTPMADEEVKDVRAVAEEGYFEPLPGKKSKKDKKKAKKMSPSAFDSDAVPNSTTEEPEAIVTSDTQAPSSEGQDVKKDGPTALHAPESQEATADTSSKDTEDDFFPTTRKMSKKDKKAKKSSFNPFDPEPSSVTSLENVEAIATQETEEPSSKTQEAAEIAPETPENQLSIDIEADTVPTSSKEVEEDLFPITRKASKKDKKKAKKLAQQSWDEIESPQIEDQKEPVVQDEVSPQCQVQEQSNVENKDVSSEQQVHVATPEPEMAEAQDAEDFSGLTRKKSKKDKKKAQKLAQQSWDEPEPVIPENFDNQGTAAGHDNLVAEEQLIEEKQPDAVGPLEAETSEANNTVKEMVSETEQDSQPTLTRKMSKKEKKKAQKLAQFLDETEPAAVDEISSTDVHVAGTQPIALEGQAADISQDTLQTFEESVSKEPGVEDFAPITRKMSKKDKKKTKKLAETSWESEDIPIEESVQASTGLKAEAESIPIDKDFTETTRSVQHDTSKDLPTSSQDMTSASEAQEGPATEDWPVVTRKPPKKDKKKAKKQTLSWDEPEQESSDVPEALPSGAPVDDNLTQESGELTIDSSPPEQRDPKSEVIAEQVEPGISAPKEAEAQDFGFSISRKTSKKDKKRKGSKQADSKEPSGAQTPTVQEATDNATPAPFDTDMPRADPGVEFIEQSDNTVEPVDVFADIPKKSKKDKKRRKSSAIVAEQTEASDPSNESAEQSVSEAVMIQPTEEAVTSKFMDQDAITTTASPDIWDNDDYFKPRAAEEKDIPPAEPPFERVEIHPVVARELGASPDKGIGAAVPERPLVGLGLIPRHSSIFNESEGYAPKLLTMTSDTPSTEARDTPRFQSPDVITQTGSPEALKVGDVDLTPAQHRSSISHEPPFDASGPDKRVKTREADNIALPEQSRPLPPNDTAPVHESGLSSREIAAEFLEKGHETSPSRKIEREAERVKTETEEASLTASERVSSSLDHETTHNQEATSAREIAALYLEHEHDLKKADSPRAPSPADDSSKAGAVAAAGALTGGVALLAQKFGGSKKAKGKKKSKSKYVDKRTPQEDDMFDDPSLWEGADRKPMEGSRMDADTATFWDVPAESEEREAHQEVTTKARDILDDSEIAESPVLGRGVNEGAMIVDRSISPARNVRGDIHDECVSTDSLPGGVAMDLDKHEEKEVRTLPTPRSPSPPPHQPESVMIEEPVLRSIEPEDDVSFAVSTPTIDFSRSLSRGLPPVQEDPAEEVEAERHDSVIREQPRRLLATPDVNRDSGFMAESPIPRQRSYHEDGQIRDSGVHLRDFPDSSPRQVMRGFSPEPTKLSRSSADPQTPEPRKADTDKQPRSKPKYPELSPAVSGGAALAAGAAVAAAGQRSVSDNTSTSQRASPQPHSFARRSASNTSISRMRTPEPLNLRPDSPGIIRHSATPPLRRVDKRVSGDLRSLSQRSETDLARSALSASKTPTPAAGEAPDLTRAAQNNTPIANEGRVRTKDMTDVYDGFGEGRIGSPRSPTRPHSMRRRQSMQVLELESKVEQLIAENRLLSEARAQAEHHLGNRAASVLAERDTEIDTLKQSIDFLRKEVERLTEVNEGLSSANATIAIQHNDRYRQLETEHADAARELAQARGAHGSYSQTLQEKDAEIEKLRAELESTKEQIREMQRQILTQNPVDTEFLDIRDVDHFDHRCQQLCSHVQQWVLRFSKFSDMRACRLTSEINDEKIIDRLDNAVLDGSDVDHYLNDRVKRRDIFMSMTMTMVWEFVFTRYLFGMDREQRQKLKSLEKLLLEVGPPQAVRQWRAVTLTLLSRRDAFKDQREQDTEAVVQAIFQTLSVILPPPSNLEDQIQTQLRRVMREAVDLAIEMRTQRAEYMMLPPLQPEYDANGDLTETVHFNASLMNERSGDNVSNEELESHGSVVRVVLFPLVVKKGDDNGVGDDEIVVSPAQVLVAKPSSSRRSIRMVTPSSDAGGVSLLRGGSPSTAPNRSNVSMAQPEAEYLEGGI